MYIYRGQYANSFWLLLILKNSVEAVYGVSQTKHSCLIPKIFKNIHVCSLVELTSLKTSAFEFRKKRELRNSANSVNYFQNV